MIEYNAKELILIAKEIIGKDLKLRLDEVDAIHKKQRHQFKLIRLTAFIHTILTIIALGVIMVFTESPLAHNIAFLAMVGCNIFLLITYKVLNN